jgi:hypothetical protein
MFTQAGEPQPQLRQMRAAMMRAKAEAAAAQDILVSAREDMLKEKKKAKEELLRPKTLGEFERGQTRSVCFCKCWVWQTCGLAVAYTPSISG